MPRVLYVEPLGLEGGMGGYNDALVAAYAEQGVTVRIVTSSSSKRLEAVAEVKLSRLFRVALDRSRSRFLRGIAYCLGYVDVIRQLPGCRVVVVHFLHQPVVDLVALAVFRMLGRRIVLIVHDPVPVLPHQRGAAFTAAVRIPQLMVVHGPAAARDLMASGVSRDKVLVVEHGDFPAEARLPAEAASRTLGVSDLQGPVALIVGNLKPGKGIAKARRALDDADGVVRSLVVSGRKQGHWDLESALDIAGANTLHVVRVDRQMSESEELAAYSLADVVLALYETGYSSGVIARSHGLSIPVVLTNVGDLARQAGPADAVVPMDYTAVQLRTAIRRALARQPPAPRLEAWRRHATLVLSRFSH